MIHSSDILPRGHPADNDRRSISAASRQTTCQQRLDQNKQTISTVRRPVLPVLTTACVSSANYGLCYTRSVHLVLTTTCASSVNHGLC